MDQHEQWKHEQFLHAMMKLTAAFRIAVDEVMIETYWEILQAFPIEALEAARRRLTRESRFFPSVAEWVDAAEDFLREDLSRKQAARLRLAQSNEPPLSKADVDRLLEDLGKHLGWPGA